MPRIFERETPSAGRSSRYSVTWARSRGNTTPNTSLSQVL